MPFLFAKIRKLEMRMGWEKNHAFFENVQVLALSSFAWRSFNDEFVNV
jgi:hypothetical protein